MTRLPGVRMDGEPLRRHRVVATSDPEAARAALTESFRPLRLRAPDGGVPPERLDCVVNAVRVADIALGYVRFGQDVIVEYPAGDHYHVEIPLQGFTESINGAVGPIRTEPGGAVLFMPDLLMCTEWRAGCAQLLLMIPQHRVRTEFETLLARPWTKQIVFERSMDLRSDPGQAWAESLRLLDRESGRSGNLLDSSRVAEHIVRVLVGSLLLTQPHNYSDLLKTPAADRIPAAVQEAVDLMRAHPAEPWTTTELARRASVSTRSLQQQFGQSVGMPPMRYLREVRLDGVREELRAADPAIVTVARVAARWGFQHLGRFAAAYAEKFGESPSQTLRS